MALANQNLAASWGDQSDAPPVARIEFDGPTYATGGEADFQQTVRDLLGRNVTVQGVVGQECGGYVPVYDPDNDKLKIFRGAGTNAPMEEVPDTTNLTAIRFRCLVFCT